MEATGLSSTKPSDESPLKVGVKLLDLRERELYAPGVCKRFAATSGEGLSGDTPAEWCNWFITQCEIVAAVDENEITHGVMWMEASHLGGSPTGCVFWGLERMQRMQAIRYAAGMMFNLHSDLLRLETRTPIGNPAGALLEDMGWQLVGTIPYGQLIDDKPVDVLFYVLTKEDL